MKALLGVLRQFGEMVGTVLFMVFYFTLFALFAVPYRVFSGRTSSQSTFHPARAIPPGRSGFTEEY